MINRLLGIVYILLHKGTVTAGELAERFEVSVRTIYRDAENLSMAGIPIYARKGKGGGISLTERFVLDRLMISQEEQRRILAALESLEEIGAVEEGEILSKLGDFFKTEPVNWVAIDFSDWSGRRKELFAQIKEAILGRRVLIFDYYGQNGEMSHRAVEPVQLLFKEYTWYIRAFCRSKKAMRLFKVLRMKRVVISEEVFEAEESRLGKPGTDFDTVKVQGEGDVGCNFPQIILQIDRKEAYRIYDRFEEEEITLLPSGDFEIHMNCALDDWTYGVILSFGPSAEVLAPAWVREEVAIRINQMAKHYAAGK